MKNIFESLSKKMSEIDPATGLFLINAGVNIGLICLTGLLSQSRNNLAEKKLEIANQTVPKPTEICSGLFDTSCFYQVESSLCDGQNTVLNFKDDVCEDIAYWTYNPGFWEGIK